MRRAPAAERTDLVEWAFAAYRPNADWTLRLGRVNMDIFLMSDHRSVGFAYPLARPPVEFYGQLPSSLDGADATRVWNDGNALWRAKLFSGRSKLAFSDADTLDLRSVLGGMLSREADGLLTRVSVVQTRLTSNVPSLQPLLAGLGGLSTLPVAEVATQANELRSRLTLENVKHTYVSFGARYDVGGWLLGGELMRVTGSVPINVSAGYASLARRWGPATVFGVVSHISSGSQPVAEPAWGAALAPLVGPTGAQQAQFLGTTAALAVNGLSPRQTTWALGTRWDLGDRLALKLQWDHIRVAASGSFLWGNAGTQATRANVGSVVLDFIF
jgi:hypothetical protein